MTDPGQHFWMGLVVEVTSLLLIFVVAFSGTRSNWMFYSEQAGYADQKQAGLWLNNLSPEPKRVATLGIEGYYAQRPNSIIPYAESIEALRYFDSQAVDFIILDFRYSGVFPEVTDWLKHGIPDKRAHLIYEYSSPKNKTEIYRWEKPPLVR